MASPKDSPGSSLPLEPLTPLPKGIRTMRPVQDLDSQTINTCQVLKSLSTDKPTAYVLDAILSSRPETGVTLLLATPITPTPDPSITPSRLTRCGPQVVIKAMEHAKGAAKHSNDPLREVAAMQLLQGESGSPYVISLLDCMQDDRFVYLVLPYLSNGDLYNRVESTDGLSEEEARRYFHDVMEGVVAMKQAGVVHHDISLENIMFDEEDHALLIDMGLSMHVEAQTGRRNHYVAFADHEYAGKPAYLSPEIARRDAYIDPYASDIWSLGCSLYAMLTGFQLYESLDDDNFQALREGAVRSVLSIDEAMGVRTLPPLAKQLIIKMLRPDPTRRPTAEEVLNHPFLKPPHLKKEKKGGKAKAASWGSALRKMVETMSASFNSCKGLPPKTKEASSAQDTSTQAAAAQ